MYKKSRYLYFDVQIRSNDSRGDERKLSRLVNNMHWTTNYLTLSHYPITKVVQFPKEKPKELMVIQNKTSPQLCIAVVRRAISGCGRTRDVEFHYYHVASIVYLRLSTTYC